MYACLHAHVCTMCVSDAPGGQKRALGPPELSYRQLWANMWVLGTQPEYSGRAASVLNPLSGLKGIYGFFEFKPGWRFHTRYIFTMKAFMVRQKMVLRTARTTGWDPFPKREQLESFTPPTLDPLNSKYLSVPVSQVAGLQAKPTRPG